MAQKPVKVTVCLVAHAGFDEEAAGLCASFLLYRVIAVASWGIPCAFPSISCSFPEACGGSTTQCLTDEELERVVLAEDALCVTAHISLLSKCCLLTRGSPADWEAFA